MAADKELSDAEYVAQMAEVYSKNDYFPPDKALGERLAAIAERLKAVDNVGLWWCMHVAQHVLTEGKVMDPESVAVSFMGSGGSHMVFVKGMDKAFNVDQAAMLASMDEGFDSTDSDGPEGMESFIDSIDGGIAATDGKPT